MGELITLQGPLGEIDPRDGNDFEAGIHFLSVVSKLYPGVRVGDLVNMGNGQMAGNPFRAVWGGIKSVTSDIYGAGKTMVGDLVGGVGDVLGKTARATGRHTGDAVRLAADEDVRDLASRAALAYASGGSSEMLQAAGGGGGKGGILEWIANLGQNWKGKVTELEGSRGVAQMEMVQWRPYIVGAAIVGGVFILARVMQPAPRAVYGRR